MIIIIIIIIVYRALGGLSENRRSGANRKASKALPGTRAGTVLRGGGYC